MTVIELIRILDDMPHNAKVYIEEGNRTPCPEMEFDDVTGKYDVII